jgi:amidase
MAKNVSTTSSTRAPIPLLRHATLSDLHNAISQRSITSEQLVKAYTARIHEVNPEFNAITELNPSARREAHLLYSPSSSPNALHGIPILIKDNIPTLDQTHTTCGSLALIGARPAHEATVVTALRKAGAVILGKANMAEWSGFRSTSGCSGWSARGGQGRGVYFPGMKASGSSGGCATAVALGLCGAAVGTEVCCVDS